MIESYGDYFRDHHVWAMPVVAETCDGVLHNITRLSETPEHALQALRSAKLGRVAEGSAGGGNGMIAYEFEGDTGASSRRAQVRRFPD